MTVFVEDGENLFFMFFKEFPHGADGVIGGKGNKITADIEPHRETLKHHPVTVIVEQIALSQSFAVDGIGLQTAGSEP